MMRRSSPRTEPRAATPRRRDDAAQRARLKSFVEESPWAAELSARQRERVVADMSMRRYRAGATVLHKGGTATAWVGIVDGLVKINSVSLEGRTVTFTGVPGGGWLGEGSLLKSEARKYDVVALRDSEVAFLPRATFNWLLDTNIGFNRYLLRQLNERLSQFIAMVEYYRLLGPDARVARCLAELFNPILYPGIHPQLRISQEELGYLSGISRQRANLALRRLSAAGLLEVEYGGVRICDLDGLRRYAGPAGAHAGDRAV